MKFDIGSNLRKIRMSKNITQVQVAKAVGLAQSDISNFEKGKAYPSVITLIKLCKYYKCKIQQIIVL